MKIFTLKYLCIFSLLTSSMSTQAATVPMADLGTEGIKVIVTSTADVIATFLGGTALYSDDLFVSSNGGASFGDAIFNNHSSALGSSVNLGKFALGTELIFKMIVNGGQATYFSGGADRNKDALAHARVQANWGSNKTLVGFEDLRGGGDKDYDDIAFALSNTNGIIDENAEISGVPLPGALWLMGSAMIGLVRFTRRKI